MSTEALNGAEAAAILSTVLKQEIHCDYKQPEDLRELLMSGDIPIEPNYAEAGVEFMRQIMDGRMGYIGSVRDDVQFITGKPSTSFEEWAIENRDRLIPNK